MTAPDRKHCPLCGHRRDAKTETLEALVDRLESELHEARVHLAELRHVAGVVSIEEGEKK